MSKPRSAAFLCRRGVLWKNLILKSIITCLFRIKLLKAEPPFEGWRLLLKRDNHAFPYTFDVENHSRKIPGKTESTALWNCPQISIYTAAYLFWSFCFLKFTLVPCHMRFSECSLQISPVWKPHLPAWSSENQEAEVNEPLWCLSLLHSADAPTLNKTRRPKQM